MELHGQHLIGNKTSAQGVAGIRGVNPATGEALEPAYPEAAPSEIDEAVRLATQASDEYAAQPGARRGAFLRRIAEELEGGREAIVARAGAETALPDARLNAELGRTIGQLGLFAELAADGSWVRARIDRALPGRQPLPKPDLRTMLRPLGPVAVFGASNFPLAFSVAGGDTASALAAGCPVVVKGHPAHPGTSELAGRAVLRAAAECGMPEGVFSLVHGATPETSLQLVRHPQIRAVGFTGSLKVGRALFDAAAARPEPIPVYAEMGSINPVFVLPGALAERAEAIAEGLCPAATLGVGQFCTQPGLVVGVAGEALRAFAQTFAEKMAAVAPGVLLTAGIGDGYRTGVDAWRKIEELELLAEAPAAAGREETQARAVVAFTGAQTFLACAELLDEVFGPATLIVACRDAAEMHAVAEALPGQLTATIHAAESEGEEFRFLQELLPRKAGRVLYGGFPPGVEVCASMIHGGPYPATTDARTTSVGALAIERFARPVCYQNAPQSALPPELRDAHAGALWRLIDGERTKDNV